MSSVLLFHSKTGCPLQVFKAFRFCRCVPLIHLPEALTYMRRVLFAIVWFYITDRTHPFIGFHLAYALGVEACAI